MGIQILDISGISNNNQIVPLSGTAIIKEEKGLVFQSPNYAWGNTAYRRSLAENQFGYRKGMAYDGASANAKPMEWRKKTASKIAVADVLNAIPDDIQVEVSEKETVEGLAEKLAAIKGHNYVIVKL